MITIGSLYVLIPRVFNRKSMYSISLINRHFQLAVTGTLFYIVSMWISGIGQGWMWRATDTDGSLIYSFVQVVEFSHWPYVGRAFGGFLYVSGMFIMAYNFYKTVTATELQEDEVSETQATHTTSA